MTAQGNKKNLVINILQRTLEEATRDSFSVIKYLKSEGNLTHEF